MNQPNVPCESLISDSKPLQDLLALLCRPVLLNSRHPRLSQRIVSDSRLRTWVTQYHSAFEDLRLDPRLLTDQVHAFHHHGRLGRYSENLLQFWFEQILRVPDLTTNLVIQGSGRTLGELDLVFRESKEAPAEHWELSVKFYISTALNATEARSLPFYVGTLIEDRLDRKLDRLLHHQLPLSQHDSVRPVLQSLGFDSPESRILMKGLFFYPSRGDWRNPTHPDEISPDHDRGWWTTSDALEIPAHSTDSRWRILRVLEWLGPWQGRVASEELLTESELRRRIQADFDRPVDDQLLRRLELTVAEVIPAGPIDATGLQPVREISRGHIVHGLWPELARSATPL